MDDGVRYLLIMGMSAAKEGDKAEARRNLERVLGQNPDTSTRTEACYWLSKISSDPREKRRYLEEILAYEPFNPRAKRELSILDGRLDPTEVINPDAISRIPAPASKTDPKRFTCPKCGGRMTYSPDGANLICESCESRERVKPTRVTPFTQGSTPAEQDFIIGMATAKGHMRPETTRTLTCQGCGAEYYLPPAALSLTCPYCNSVYVVDKAGSRGLIAPSGVIPFKIDRTFARQSLQKWLASWGETTTLPSDTPKGFYFPAWCFTVTGQMPWNGQRYQDRKWIPFSGVKVIFIRELLIPASAKAAALFPGEVKGYDLTALVAYDPSYLVDWAAETYQIPMSDASLNARQVALEMSRKQVEDNFVEQVRNLSFDSAGLAIESFKLILLPAWSAQLRAAGRQQQVMVNGQNGRVWGSSPGAKGLIKKIFG